MNVSLKEKSEQKVIFTIEIGPDDYAPGVEKTLKNLKNKGSFQGFRKGKVPLGHVKRIYGSQAKVEEVQNLVAEGVEKAIRENELSILGQPIMLGQDNGLDFSQDSFQLDFAVALSPEIKELPGKEISLPYYKIDVTDEMVGEQVEAILKQTPNYIEADKVEENDLISGTICELGEDGKPKEGGLRKEDSATMLVSVIKDDEEKAKFVDSSVNSVVVFNPLKAFDGSVVELASILGVKKTDLGEEIPESFSFEIQKITRTQEPELNQEFFDKIFGEGVVKSEDEMRAKIKESMESQLKPQSENKFYQDFRTYFVENKAKEIELDTETIKTWFQTTEEGMKMFKEGTLDEHFDKMMDDLKFHIYVKNIKEKNDIKVDDEELKNFAASFARMQFAQYGMSNLPDEVIENYADSILKDQQKRDNLVDNIETQKMIEWVLENVTLEEKGISQEDFNNMIAESSKKEETSEEPESKDEAEDKEA